MKLTADKLKEMIRSSLEEYHKGTPTQDEPTEEEEEDPIDFEKGEKVGGKVVEEEASQISSALEDLVREEIAMVIGEDEDWIQDAEKDIEKRGTEGVCTGDKFGGPTCRKGTKRYNLAKTFRKMAKARKKK